MTEQPPTGARNYVTHRRVETGERIELVFGKEASFSLSYTVL